MFVSQASFLVPCGRILLIFLPFPSTFCYGIVWYMGPSRFHCGTIYNGYHCSYFDKKTKQTTLNSALIFSVSGDDKNASFITQRTIDIARKVKKEIFKFPGYRGGVSLKEKDHMKLMDDLVSVVSRIACLQICIP